MKTKFSEYLKSFYNDYVRNGSNIHETAVANGLTKTQCYILVQFGKTLSND